MVAEGGTQIAGGGEAGGAQFRNHSIRKGGTVGLQITTAFQAWVSTCTHFSTIHGFRKYVALRHILIFKRLGYIIGW